MFIENMNSSDENQISSTTNSYQHPEQINIGIMNLQEPISINTVDSTQESDNILNDSLEENPTSSNAFDIEINKEDQINRSTNSVETVKIDCNQNRICYSKQELIEFSKCNFCNNCPEFLIQNLKAPTKKLSCLEDKFSKNKCKSIHFIQNLTPKCSNFSCGCSVNNSFKVTLNNKNSFRDEDYKATKNFSNNNSINFHFRKTEANRENDSSEKNYLSAVNKQEEKRDQHNFLKSRGENLNFNFANARQIINPNYNKSDRYNKNNEKHEEEPEWFTNPICQHDTIELKGFEDDDKINLENSNAKPKNVHKNIPQDNSKKFDINEIFKFDYRKYTTESAINKIQEKESYEPQNTSRFSRWFNKQKKIENQFDQNINSNEVKNVPIKNTPLNETCNYNINQPKEEVDDLVKSEQQLINILQKARINVDNFINYRTNEKLIKEQAKSVSELEADFLKNSNDDYNLDSLKHNVKTERDVNGIFVPASNENSINPFVMNLLGDAQKQKKLKQINYLENICNGSNFSSNFVQSNNVKSDENKPHPFMPTCVIRKIAKDKNVFNKNINESQFETVTGKHLNERAILKNFNDSNQQIPNLDYSNNSFIQKLLDQKVSNVYQSQNAFTNLVQKDLSQTQFLQEFNDGCMVDNQFTKEKLLNAQKLENIENFNYSTKEKQEFENAKSWDQSTFKKILFKTSTNSDILSITTDKTASVNISNKEDQFVNQKRLIEILQKASKGIQDHDTMNSINKFFDSEMIENSEKNLSGVKPKVLLLEDIEKN